MWEKNNCNSLFFFHALKIPNTEILSVKGEYLLFFSFLAEKR